MRQNIQRKMQHFSLRANDAVQMAHRQLRTTDLSKPTYRGSVIASLLGTVRRGRNHDTFKKITMGLLELKTRSAWVRVENEHEKHAGYCQLSYG